jgi:hypothetical protein
MNLYDSHLPSYKADIFNCLQNACEHKLTGINDELKHINQEVKKLRPEQAKVLL